MIGSFLDLLAHWPLFPIKATILSIVWGVWFFTGIPWLSWLVSAALWGAMAQFQKPLVLSVIVNHKNYSISQMGVMGFLHIHQIGFTEVQYCITMEMLAQSYVTPVTPAKMGQVN